MSFVFDKFLPNWHWTGCKGRYFSNNANYSNGKDKRGNYMINTYKEESIFLFVIPMNLEFYSDLDEISYIWPSKQGKVTVYMRTRKMNSSTQLQWQ